VNSTPETVLPRRRISGVRPIALPPYNGLLVAVSNDPRGDSTVSQNAIVYLAPLGRVLLSLIFLGSAVGKLQDWQGTAQMMTDRGLPAVDALLSIVVGLELVGGLMVMLGLYTRSGVLLLLIFLVPASVVMHNFWTMPPGPDRMNQMAHFMKNLSIIGGLIFVLAMGPGPLAIDALMRRKPAAPLSPTSPPGTY
jgi:uncharacterized membrane protein YphA (DoxX/SURF4 family)